MYDTSADLDFCHYCGSFGNSCGCTDYEILTDEDVINYILSLKDLLEEENFYIRYELFEEYEVK